MSDEEKQQICTWVENGCPRGDDSDLPPPREFVDGWQIGEPDQVVYMRDEPYRVPAEGVIEYQFFTVDPGWTTDRWIQAAEARPSNRAVVHHIRVYIQPENVTDPVPPEGISITHYAPGMSPNVCPPGTAVHVPANSKLVVQMHYTPNGTEQQDRSMIGIRFADPQSVKRMVRGRAVGRNVFSIPAGEPNYEMSATHVLQADTLLLSLTPHTHLRGKSAKFEAEFPNGTTEVLLNVPDFDFNWQLRYLFQEPKLMPKGSKLRFTARYDNSANNPANPDPTKVVSFGNQTWDEMMEGYYTSIDADQDAACIALVALSLAVQPSAAHSPVISAALDKLFDLGAQVTPAAVEAAKAQYHRLKSSHTQDPRIDYAFALVLVNQQQYREALSVLSDYLAAGEGDLYGYCVQMWAQMAAHNVGEVLEQAKALAERFPPTEKSPSETKYHDAARDIGMVFANLTHVDPAMPDVRLIPDVEQQVLHRLGKTYDQDFVAGYALVAEAEKGLRNAETPLNSGPEDSVNKGARVKNFSPFPYETERRRVLSWYSR